MLFTLLISLLASLNVSQRKVTAPRLATTSA